jgi:hypothetical protein
MAFSNVESRPEKAFDRDVLQHNFHEFSHCELLSCSRRGGKREAALGGMGDIELTDETRDMND